VSVAIGIVLVSLGLIGLTVFCLIAYPPSAIVPISVALIALGLLIDWEALRGKLAKPHRPQR
jgi:hypothetical protein